MSNKNDLSPREFLRQARFSPEQADKRFRNARSHIENGLFISHSGLDYHRILDQIVDPVMYKLNDLRGRADPQHHPTEPPPARYIMSPGLRHLGTGRTGGSYCFQSPSGNCLRKMWVVTVSGSVQIA